MIELQPRICLKAHFLSFCHRGRKSSTAYQAKTTVPPRRRGLQDDHAKDKKRFSLNRRELETNNPHQNLQHTSFRTHAQTGGRDRKLTQSTESVYVCSRVGGCLRDFDCVCAQITHAPYGRNGKFWHLLACDKPNTHKWMLSYTNIRKHWRLSALTVMLVSCNSSGEKTFSWQYRQKHLPSFPDVKKWCCLLLLSVLMALFITLYCTNCKKNVFYKGERV